ncbi:MAG: hypothetical protein F2818_02130 [Actinobacteria bacterium]|jgi:uncharacterized cupredoxin-like copper-binding protein|nr:hypothetical protein [Actinomycetota bacterium]
MMKRSILKVVPVALFLTVATAGCAADSNDASSGGNVTNNAAIPQSSGNSNIIVGTEKEWAIEIDHAEAKVGYVTFVVSNIGKIGHEFLVVKTDIEDGKIALAGDHFEEPSPGLEVIDEIGEYAVGETHSLTLNLEAGNYQLVCNLPAHYGSGMHIPFKVA